MTSSELVTTLQRSGCRVHTVDGQLRVRDPQRALTPELHHAIRTHKAALLALAPFWEEASTLIATPRPAPALSLDAATEIETYRMLAQACEEPVYCTSTLLDGGFYLCATREQAEPLLRQGLVAYLPVELRILRHMSPVWAERFPDSFGASIRPNNTCI